MENCATCRFHNVFWVGSGCVLLNGGEHCNYQPADEEIIRQLKDKLSRYEQAEKEGRLVVLPCKELFESQGDYLYMVYDDEVLQLVNCSCSIGPDGIIYVACCADDKIFPCLIPDAEHDLDTSDLCTNYIDFEASDFGKTVFLTHEEAAAALKERENDG